MSPGWVPVLLISIGWMAEDLKSTPSPRPRLCVHTQCESSTHLWEIHTEGVHVHAVEKTGEAFAEARQTLMHQLQMHEIGLQIRHGIGQLGKLWLQGIDGGLVVSRAADSVTVAICFAERGARARS